MGRTQIKLPEIPGRGIVKLDDFYEFQACVAVNEESPLERIKKLRSEAEILAANWDGDVPKQIPIVPEVLTMNYFFKIPSVKQVISNPNKIALGVDFEKVEAVNLPLGQYPITIGINKNSIQNIVKTILQTAGSDVGVTILDNDKKELNGLGFENNYFSNIDEINDFLSKIYDRIDEIDKERIKITNNEDILKDEKHQIVIFNDLDNYSIRSNNPGRDETVFEIIKDAGLYKITFVLISEMSKYSQINPRFKNLFSYPTYALITSKIADSKIVNISAKMYGEPDVKIGEANLVENGEFKKIKLIDEA